MSENPLYKKAYFQCARRAILENEVVMVQFAENIVKDKYSDEKLNRLNELLTKMYDNDMYDILMGVKRPEFFAGTYDGEICREMAEFAEDIREKVKNKNGGL